MIFVFVDDGTLEIIASPQEARRNYEGIDVERGSFRFFDEHGAPLEPRFTQPNRTGRLLGIISWVESGDFELVPAPASGEDNIFEHLLEVNQLEPNPWFKDLDEVKRFLTSRCSGRVD